LDPKTLKKKRASPIGRGGSEADGEGKHRPTPCQTFLKKGLDPKTLKKDFPFHFNEAFCPFGQKASSILHSSFFILNYLKGFLYENHL